MTTSAPPATSEIRQDVAGDVSGATTGLGFSDYLVQKAIIDAAGVTAVELITFRSKSRAPGSKTCKSHRIIYISLAYS